MEIKMIGLLSCHVMWLTDFFLVTLYGGAIMNKLIQDSNHKYNIMHPLYCYYTSYIGWQFVFFGRVWTIMIRQEKVLHDTKSCYFMEHEHCPPKTRQTRL